MQAPGLLVRCGDVAALADRESRTRARLAAGERLADINGLDLSKYLP